MSLTNYAHLMLQITKSLKQAVPAELQAGSTFVTVFHVQTPKFQVILLIITLT